jgi:hypothetical protein
LEENKIEKSIRYRINTAISTKGQITWDCTAETTGYSRDDALAESDALVAELKKRYPASIPAPEGK